jgi:phage baseplate assembly protein W
MDIIEYNSLVSPYISTEDEDRFLTYAQGYMYVKRENAQSDVTVKKGWKLHTKPSILNAVVKTYVTTQDVTIPAGTSEAYLHVRSMVPGLQGNTLNNAVQVLGDDFARHFVHFSVVTNPSPIRGGIEGKVLTTGDYLFIPSEENDILLTTDGGYNRAKYFYGEDIKLEQDDFVISLNGDLATVSFVDNVKQAVAQRLKAEKGDNPSDYNWGTNIPTIIGNGSIPAEALPKRLEIEILEALSYEDRIHEPTIKNIHIQPSEGSVRIDVAMKVVSLEEVIELIGLQIGGTV